MAAITIKQLLEAGVHFGHQTRRWNPKMKQYIFGERNGIYIIDLQKTLKLFREAVEFITSAAAEGKTVLFVGTKRQAQESVEEEARRCGMYFVNNRWLGGLLTNFPTVQNSLKRYKELETMRAEGFYDKLSKKEAARVERERKKLEKNLRGIREMDRLPGAVFVVDSNTEAIAVKEAAKLEIPIVAIVDTNCDPDQIDYVIPGNDDALRAVRLFASTISDAIIAGRNMYQAKVEAEAKEAEERAAKEAAARKAAKEAKEAARKVQPPVVQEAVTRQHFAETKRIISDVDELGPEALVVARTPVPAEVIPAAEGVASSESPTKPLAAEPAKKAAEGKRVVRRKSGGEPKAKSKARPDSVPAKVKPAERPERPEPDAGEVSPGSEV